MSLVGRWKPDALTAIYNSRNYMSLVGLGVLQRLRFIYNSRNYMSLVGREGFLQSG